MNKLIKHNETKWSMFYDTPQGGRHCVDMVVKNNKVVEVECVWVLTEDGYNDCIINNMHDYFEMYHDRLQKTMEELL